MLGARRTGASVGELAGELNVSVRTVYRDLEVLERVGVPLVKEREGAEVSWRMLEGHGWQSGIPLALEEVVALHVAGGLLDVQGGDAWSEAVRTALEKVKAAVPGKLLARLSEHLEGVSASGRGVASGQRQPRVVAAVGRALAERRRLMIIYATPGRAATPGRGRAGVRTVEPLRLHLHGGGLYLIADDSKSGEVRTFLVDRIEKAEVLEERFEPREAFDLETYFADAFAVYRGGTRIHLVAVVEASVAHLIEERRWHPSQETRRHDGVLELHLDVADTPELRAWLRSYGSALTVVKPPVLVKAMGDEARALARRYAPSTRERRVREPKRVAARGRRSGK